MAIAPAKETRAMTSKSSHVSDPFLQPFILPNFDPANYLNSTLPSLSISSQPPATRVPPSPSNASLLELSSQTQALLSQLNAQASRLTTVLTQLTDDILRSGARLSYEVDVLRGEAIGLSDALNDGLRDDIQHFSIESAKGDHSAMPGGTVSTSDAIPKEQQPETSPMEPPYIEQLRTLTHVRQRLESVIQVFGEAMKWTLPPSEVSLTSSLISVSGPEPGADSVSREEKGREFAESVRMELANLIVGSNNRADGYDAALARIGALRDLVQVWKGTAEEKARVRFVEGLIKFAEDRLRELEREDGTRFRDARSESPRKTSAFSRSGRS